MIWKRFLVWGGGLGISLVLAAAQAADWPHWRGPNHDSIAPEVALLEEWPEGGPERLWQMNIGAGFSSVAVSQGRVYASGNQAGEDTVYCLDARDGTLIWRFDFECPSGADSWHEGGPSATPTVDGDYLYVFSKFGHLICLNLGEGSEVWRRDLQDEYDVNAPGWGFASSPLVAGELLIVNAGTQGMAFDKHSGDLVWPSKPSGVGGYSSAVPFSRVGQPAVVMLAFRHVVSLSLEDGSLLWDYEFRTSADSNISDPTPYQGGVFVTSRSKAGRWLQLDNPENVTDAWRSDDLKSHMDSGVIVDGLLFGFNGAVDNRPEVLVCIDMANGELKWQQPMDTGQHGGTVIAADGRILALAGDGQLRRIKADGTSYQEEARMQMLTGKCWTMPSLAGDTLFGRNEVGDLVAYRIAETGTPPEISVGRLSEGRLRLTWPQDASLQVESRSTLHPESEWIPLGQSPESDGEHFHVDVDSVGEAGFYRLHQP